MHDVFYTKAAVIYSFWGGVLRFVSFSCIISVFGTFLLSQCNQSYKTIDVIISYVLLAGAIGLEIYSVLLLLASDWTILWLSKHRNIAVHLFYKDISLFAPSENKRWSNSIAPYNLVSFCLKDEPARYHYCRFFKRVPCICRLMEKYLYKSTPRVPKELKVLIFEQLLKKLTSDFSNRKKLCAQRGRWVLVKEICDLERVGWSIEDAEFDQSILLWHIATDLVYHIDLDEDSTSVRSPNAKENSKLLSEYMLYLLVTHPFMLPNGIGQIRFQDACAEAMEFFEERKSITDTKKACEALLDEASRCYSTPARLRMICNHWKNNKNWDKEKKWELISHVWAEMLSYAASQCQRSQHAQQLRQGGELLTHVWLLMAHLGITEQFQISKGHARAKPLVQ